MHAVLVDLTSAEFREAIFKKFNPFNSFQAATTTTASGVTSTPLPTKYNYSEVITKSLLFYYAQRSGALPNNDNPIPYRSNSALNDKGQNGEDLTGGYYDGNIL